MRRKIHAVLLAGALAATALVATATPAAAVPATLVVDDDGIECPSADHTTIQDALNVVAPGDTITVCAGTYDEQLDITEQVTLSGAGTTASVVQPTVDPATLPGGHGPKADVFLGAGASGTTIEGFGFDFNGTDGNRTGWGIAVSDQDGPAVENVTIRNNDIQMGLGAGAGGSGQGLGVTTGRNADVDGLMVTGNAFHGDQSDTGIGDNAGAEGVYVNPSMGTGTVTVSDNTFDGQLFVGISVESSNVVVSRNTVEDTLTPNQANTHGIRVNDFFDNGHTNVTISDNVVTGFGNALRVGDGTDSANSSTVTVDGNLLRNSTTGILVRNDAAVTATRNAVVGNTTGADLDGVDGTLDATETWWGAADGPAGQGAGSGDTVADATITFDPWLASVDVVAVPASQTVGSSVDVTATVRDSDGFDAGDAPLEAGFIRTGANPQATPQVDPLAPTATHTYTGTAAGTDTVTAAVRFGNTASMLTGSTTVTWTSGGGGGGTTTPTTSVTEDAAPGDSVGTDTEGDGATAADPVEATVTIPSDGTGGEVSVTTSTSTDETADGFAFLDLQVDITAPTQTAGSPLEIVFEIDASLLPAGETAATLVLFRDGTLVAECTGASGVADPDPCVSDRTQQDDGDALLTVLTSQASAWTVAEIVDACPAQLIGDAGFTDVGDGNVHGDAIDCVAHWGLTTGFTATSFAPAEDVTRGQMASFLARLVVDAGVVLPSDPDATFSDVGTGVHATAIRQLADLGVIEGYTDGTYRPSEAVSRAQTAALAVRSYELAASTVLSTGDDAFSDDDGGVFEVEIDKAAAAGFVEGTTSTTFEPTRDVRRDEMASILSRVLQPLVDADLASPPLG